MPLEEISWIKFWDEKMKLSNVNKKGLEKYIFLKKTIMHKNRKLWMKQSEIPSTLFSKRVFYFWHPRNPTTLDHRPEFARLLGSGRISMIFLTIILSLNSVFAADLSEYPGIFVENNQFNAVIVVGDDASSSDVLAQSSIGVSLVKNLNIEIKGVNKLASEVKNLNINIISIGNPCVNELTEEIMGFPSPCNKNFEEGKAYLKLLEKDNYDYLIVAGRSDDGTRKIADILANYNDYDLTGKEYIIDASLMQDASAESEIDGTGENKTEKKSSKNDLIESDKQKIIDELTKKIEEKKEEETTKTQEAIPEEETQEQPKRKENLIKRFMVWLVSVFR